VVASFVVANTSGEDDFSRKGAKPQSDTAFPGVFFAPLREKHFLIVPDKEESTNESTPEHQFVRASCRSLRAVFNGYT